MGMCRRQLAVKLIAGHSAGGERPGSRPGRPDAAGVPWLAFGSGPEPGHEPTDGQGRRPWIIQRTGPRQAATPPRERHSRAGRLQFSSLGRGRRDCRSVRTPPHGARHSGRWSWERVTVQG